MLKTAQGLPSLNPMQAHKLSMCLVGTGKLARQLARRLQGSGLVIHQVIGTEEKKAAAFAAEFSIPQHSASLDSVSAEVNFVFIATQDHAIAAVAAALAGRLNESAVVVHASGSAPLSLLRVFGDRSGVVYPMQTFTLGREVDFSQIPVFIEYGAAAEAAVKALAHFLSQRVIALDSAQRQRLHLGAVFACNFPNLMWILTQEWVQDLPGVNGNIYEHLVRENVDNVFTMGARESLTGPALRGDEETMQRHLLMLQSHPQMQEVYALLSRIIQDLSKT